MSGTKNINSVACLRQWMQNSSGSCKTVRA